MWGSIYWTDYTSPVSDTIIADDEENPRYRGGYIPSKVFKMLDESGNNKNIFQFFFANALVFRKG